MSELGKRFLEISRGYKKISDAYHRPYITGVDINDIKKPFIVAMGDHHSDFAANVITTNELISGKWDEHIELSNSAEFIEQLKKDIQEGQKFPTKCVLEIVNNRI